VKTYHGDCLEVMPQLPAQSVQMVFSDLPYGVTQCAWDQRLDMASLWQRLHIIGLPNASYVFSATHPFVAPVIMSWQKGFKYEIIWQKTRPSGAMLAKRQVMRDHENILIFYAKQCTFNPQKVPVQDHNAYRPKTIYRSTKQSAMFGGGERNKIVVGRNDDGTRYPRSVQRFSSLKSTHYLHPTQKPVALLEWLIKTYTHPGDTILDPVAGSGTSAIAALRTGRNAIVIEKDAAYYDVMCKRIEAEKRALQSAPESR
jgi:site-specific DNA-methyltransferase (adenine-specific)